MIFCATELTTWDISTEVGGRWVPARPTWHHWGRWKHAWWVLTGRCDAVWWPENGNPYAPGTRL